MSSLLQGFRFVRKESPIHRMDPRSKFFWGCGVAALSFLLLDYIPQIILFFSLLPFVIVGKVTRRWLTSLKSMTPIILFIAMLDFFYLGPLYALTMSLRILNLTGAFSVFFLTVYPDDLGTAMTKLRIPYEFTFMFMTAVRYVPTLARETDDIINAYKARGIELERSRLKNLRKYAGMLVPLIVCSMKRSLRLAEALEARGFGSVKKRTFYRELKMSKGDYLLIAFTVIIVFIGVLTQKCWIPFGGLEHIEIS